MKSVPAGTLVRHVFESPVAGVVFRLLLGGFIGIWLASCVLTRWRMLRRPGPAGARARFALPWLAWLAAVSLTLQGHLAWRWIDQVEQNRLAACGFALCSMVLWRLVWGAGLRVGQGVVSFLVAQGRTRDLPLPWCLSAATVAFAAPLALGIALGDGSGYGGFWRLWGAAWP